MSDAGAPPDVSVVIPTYNRLWCLPDAVESCRGSRARVEIVVVDDGSTDGTAEWLATQTDVRWLRTPNRGKDWAVAAGFALARAPYVKFLDSDDRVLAGTIDGQLAAALRANADVVVSGYEAENEKGECIKRMNWVPSDDFIAQQLGESDSSHYSAYLFRRDFIADVPHRQEYGVVDDRMFVIEVAMKEPRVAVVAEPAIRLRHHGAERLQFPNGIAAVAKHHAHLTLYRRVLAQLEQEGRLTPRRAKAAAGVIWLLAHAVAYTHPDEGVAAADWVRRLDPTFVPPEPGLLGTLYRRLGFRATERILRLRRALVSRIPAARGPR